MNVLARQGRKLQLLRYDDFTIESYFRNQGALVGHNNRIEVRSLGTEPFLVAIENHCTIAPGVRFLTHDGATWLFTDEIPDLQRFGKIHIKDNCFIGTDAIIMPGVCIGPNSVVGAGAIVTKDVPPDSVAVGNPARVVSSVAEYKLKAIATWSTQKPAGYFDSFPKGLPTSPRLIAKYKKRDWALLKEHLTRIL